MHLNVIVLLLIISYNANYLKACRRVARDNKSDQEEATTTDVSTTLSADSEELEKIIKNKDVTSASILFSKIANQAHESRKSDGNEESSKIGLGKAYTCSKLLCTGGDKITPVCACNFNTGNVASFRNKCDVQKHNCRFDTNFKVILEDICPWEFSFRSVNKKYAFDYRDPKYYN